MVWCLLTEECPPGFSFPHKLFRADIALLEVHVAVGDAECTDVAVAVEPLSFVNFSGVQTYR